MKTKTAWSLGILVLMPLSAILHGVVLSIMWDWFVVSSLHAPPLHVAAAMGVSLIISLLTAHVVDEDRNKEAVKAIPHSRAFWHAFQQWIILPGMVLLFGWVLKHFVARW